MPRPGVTQTYRNVRKLVFTLHLVEVAKLTLVASTKYESQSQHEAPSQHEEKFHLDSSMFDLNANEEHNLMEQVIMEKDVKRERIKDNLSKENFMISFVEQENEQLNVKQLILEKKEVYIGKEGIKGKEVMDVEVSYEHQEQVGRKRARIRGLQRALEHQREEMTSADLFVVEINEDRQFWLEKVNCHLERLLKRANKDNMLQRHMDTHYYTRNYIASVKVKLVKEKLSETLIKEKGKVTLDFPTDSSLIASHNT